MTKQGKSLEELGRRAAACKHWRWMPGMLTLKGLNDTAWRVLEKPKRKMHGLIITDSDAIVVCNRGEQPGVPDFSDPATLGCLLHLVQEAWNACRISVCFSAYTPDATKRWSVPISYFKEQRDLVHVPSFYGSTQAEALVAALEAAP